MRTEGDLPLPWLGTEPVEHLGQQISVLVVAEEPAGDDGKGRGSKSTLAVRTTGEGQCLVEPGEVSRRQAPLDGLRIERQLVVQGLLRARDRDERGRIDTEEALEVVSPVIVERCAGRDDLELVAVGTEAKPVAQVAHDHRDLRALRAAVEVELVHHQA